ncbi:MAG TPA: ABC transporter ATP-binding protein [Nitrososphaeraceae archaeon]|nr:ABC transporter ATP-binding protein [Nitrososphaeraceae archaeon]
MNSSHENDNSTKSNHGNDSMALEVRNLYKFWDSQAGRVIGVANISFGVRKGEFVSIVGPSGSGKSTLLNMLGALERPSSGQVFINGIDIFSMNDTQAAMIRNKSIGFIFQSYNLINRTNVLKNVEFPAIIGGMNKSERRMRATKLLNFLGLKSKLKSKPSNLSGGEQQRVAIARSLMNNPAIILADEPTGNLDTKTGADVFGLLKLLSNKFRRTIVMVTHNHELAANTERSIHIKDGRIEKQVKNFGA